MYRTLEIFTVLGLINKLDFGGGRKIYELTERVGNKKHHHHMACNSCGRTIDYSDFLSDEIEFLNKVERKLELKHNFKIQDHYIEFTGLCNTCFG